MDQLQKVVRRIENLTAFISRIEVKCSKAKIQIEKLRTSILAKAFRGDLVPQNPKDEPAWIVLERIRKNLEQENIKSKNIKRVQRKAEKVKVEPVKSIEDLIKVIDDLGGKAFAKNLLTEAKLDNDIDLFYELLREGYSKQLLDVPIGQATEIKRKKRAT